VYLPVKLTKVITYAAFTHAGLTARYWTKSLHKTIFVLVTRYIVMKRIKSPLKIAGLKFEFKNLEIRFHKRFVPGCQNLEVFTRYYLKFCQKSGFVCL